MRVAIVHYHLAPGGVTSVIRSASRVLADVGITHVVLGGTDAEPPVRQVAGLGYLTDAGELTAGLLLERLHEAATDALGGPPDLWHFHNPTLGKNILLPAVIDLLATAGERLVLQLHDLAENGRPTNFPLIADRPRLYPIDSRIRYAFLNTRDRAIFLNAGLPPEHAILLPNPVSVAPTTAPPPGPPLLFAPIRGIRRKNLGELVLLAALAPHDYRIAISRAPENPESRPIHDSWRDFADRLRLPVEFGVTDRTPPAPGAGCDFESWVSHASHFVTTSVEEGFGLPFFEAAALGKPLLGRNLRHLTAPHGLDTTTLYDRLLVPATWIDTATLRRRLVAALAAHHRAYRRSLPLSAVAETLDCLVRDGLVDFGDLPEDFQQHVVRRILDDGLQSATQVESNGDRQPAVAWLADCLAIRTSGTALPAACAPASCRQTLIACYTELMEAPRSPLTHIPPEAILSAHLAPESFHFLLTRPFPPPLHFRAVIFDIYGTLLDAPSGRVRPDPAADPRLREIIREFGFDPPASPSGALHAAVARHHAASDHRYPEIDLRELWREILALPPNFDTAPLVIAIETSWHPATLMPGAAELVDRLAGTQLPLGLLSNAQCNALGSLGAIAEHFATDLTLLSYQQGIAKPSPELFQFLVSRLAARGITPEETLFVGNDPLHDIAPAAAVGMRTALFTDGCGRSGKADFTYAGYRDLAELFLELRD